MIRQRNFDINFNPEPVCAAKRNKDTRDQWTRKHRDWSDEWLSVLDSDEKKLNLDGPDGWAYEWHDICKDSRTSFYRIQGGGSLMVWAAFSYNGTTHIAFLKGRQYFEHYQKKFEVLLLPFGKLLREGTNGYVSSVHRN